MKWGILATGNIAGTFASTLRQMEGEGQTLAAVGSRRAESAAAFAGRYGIPRAHGSYEALAADPSVEAVYVATPNSLHDPDVCTTRTSGSAWKTASTCCAKSRLPSPRPRPGSCTPWRMQRGCF